MWKKLRVLVYVATFLCTITLSPGVPVVVSAAEDEGVFQQLKSQYDGLSARGKLFTGAAVGFVGSRLALGTVTKVVKLGAGAFIVAEALKMTGLMDDIPSFSAEQNDLITKFKGRVLQETENFRVRIRETLTQERVQAFFDHERMCAFGLAGGVVVGAVL